jgi:peptide chain release factor 2
LNAPDDQSNAFIEIHAAAGGHESCDFTQQLVTMYTGWAKSKSFKHEIIESTPGEVVGYRNILIQITGEYAYGWLKNESGAHRFVRVSKWDSMGRRHTSFASVNVFAEKAEEGAMSDNIPAGDLKIETMRSQGAGGQSVNTTDSAVRITHLPTKISAFVCLLFLSILVSK